MFYSYELANESFVLDSTHQAIQRILEEIDHPSVAICLFEHVCLKSKHIIKVIIINQFERLNQNYI